MLNKHSQTVAVGEVGLDFFIRDYDKAKQCLFFETQVECAKTSKLPLILHVRKAHDQVSSMLKKKNFHHGGVVHCYSGSYQQATRYLDLGFKLGIGGVVTYPRSTRLHKLVKDLPLDSFVLETDAPDIPPLGKERQRNRPDYLPEIFKAFADLRNEALEEISEQVYHNTTSLFSKLNRYHV
jgi:TatD DNase family protein